VSVFGVEEKTKQKTSLKAGASKDFALVSCLAYFSTLNMEATCSSKMSVDFQRTAQRYIPAESTDLRNLGSSVLKCSDVA
jgi:hypothetical protein